MARPPRLRDFAYRGRYSYFLTFCTYRRRTAFEDSGLVASVLQHFRSTATRTGFALSAYCFMPDHLHLLVRGLRDDAELQRFTKSAKQGSGQLRGRREGEPLWQAGYYDRVVRPEESLLHIARYIVENPVRAGLVSRSADYAYLGSDEWTLDEILKS